MDWIGLRQTGGELVKKYRMVLLVILAGILLMLLPGRTPEAVEPAAVTVEPDLQEELAQILSQLEGAGKVRVLLTQAQGALTRYQADEDTGTNSARTDTVLVTTTDRGEAGLVQQVIPPIYRGAVVVCQGAGKASVRLAIVEAVANATGLPTNQISVLKMK